MNKHLFVSQERGQAMISLLFFVVISVIVTSTAVIVLGLNALSTSKIEQGNYALSIAESGAEEAMIRLLRDPNYAGEVVTIGSDTATVSVTGGTNKTITSVGTSRNFVRTIQVTTSYNNNVLTVTSWKEIF